MKAWENSWSPSPLAVVRFETGTEEAAGEVVSEDYMQTVRAIEYTRKAAAPCRACPRAGRAAAPPDSRRRRRGHLDQRVPSPSLARGSRKHVLALF